ncbi:MAG: hypothetical protein E6J88_01515 [Deltaproteobacteria bacterium]|nr:MAG: hypothetical protein E6J88_01515 [Deltaproteobacteria bacterium]
MLIDLRLAIWEAIALLVLFAAQFPFPQTGVRLAFSAVYVALAAGLLVRHLRGRAGAREDSRISS